MGVRHPGQTVHEHQDALAARAEILRDRMGQVRGLQAHHRRHIGRRGHHHRSTQAFFTQGLRDEGLHLAPALAHQPDHHDIGLREACEHAQQHALAHPRPGDQAQALAAADRQQPIDGLHTHIQGFVYRPAVHGVQGITQEGNRRFANRIGRTVQRLPAAIHHATQQRRSHLGFGPVVQQPHGGAWPHAMRLGVRHQVQGLIVEAHHLGFQAVTKRTHHFAQCPHRRHQALGVQGHADQADQTPRALRLQRPNPVQGTHDLISKIKHDRSALEPTAGSGLRPAAIAATGCANLA